MGKFNDIVEVDALNLPSLEIQVQWFPCRPLLFVSTDALSGFDLLPVEDNIRANFAISTIFVVFRLMGSRKGTSTRPQSLRTSPM